MSKNYLRGWFILCILILVAFVLRVFRLDHQSLWYDEAFSVFLARMPLGEITARTAADIQPPLYYYLLHFWNDFAGASEFSVRFLSLFFGVLTVPLLFVVARRTLNFSAAFFAVLLATFSPLYLWYAQEARMYTLITFLGLLSSYTLLRATQTRGRWWWAFVIVSIAAVYTHYFAFALLAFQWLYWLWRVLARQAQGTLRAGLGSFAAIVVAFLPWVPFVVARFGEDASYWRGALKFDEAIRHIFINFTMGESVLEDIARELAGAWLVILCVGLIAWLLAKTRPTFSLSFVILYLVVPLALLLFLFSRNPKFNARYLMIASPGLILMFGAGLASWWTLARRGNILARVFSSVVLVASCIVLFGTAVYADSNVYFESAFTKADFRGVVQYITTHARDDEAIVLSSGHMFPAFDYYYTDAKLPELRLPDDVTLNAEHVLNFSVADDLNRGLAGKQGVWLVQWQDEVTDPNGILPLLFTANGNAQKVDASFWQIKLQHWALSPDAHFVAAPSPKMPRRANFKNKIELLGWDAPHATPADQGASFNLYFQSLDTFTDDYSVALRIVDAQGNVWGKLDRRPSGYNYPTTRWQKGENLFGNYTVPLLPGAPAGEYYVTVTFFTASNQTGLDVLADNGAPLGKSVKVGPIPVLPAEKQSSIVALNIQHTLSTRVAPFTLLGYALPRDKASTGESIPLTLFWRADNKPSADYSFQIQFGDKYNVALPLANATFPTTQWRADEIVRTQYLVQIPTDASAGDVNLKLKLSDNQTLDLQQVFTIEKTDRVFVKPSAQFAQDANFNNLIALTGYSFSAPQIKASDTLTITLNWKAQGKMDKLYTVFVHLLDKDSKVVAQKDAQPLGGARATPTWVEGEYLTDTLAFQLKPDALLGEYRVEIGWYDGSDPSFARLQVIDANGNGAGDNVILNQTVMVQ